MHEEYDLLESLTGQYQYCEECGCRMDELMDPEGNPLCIDCFTQDKEDEPES